MADQHLLNTRQMARFTADGFLRFDNLVPAELNEAVCAQFEGGLPRNRAGTPLAEIWQASPSGQSSFEAHVSKSVPGRQRFTSTPPKSL